MGREKFSADQMAEYYREVHRKFLETEPRDTITPITCPTEPRWVNYFVNFAHQLGMEKAFAFLKSNLGSLRGRCVLDLGCGRGRWARKYASLGCRVTGVDFSVEAVKVLGQEMPEHQFLCQDISKLIVPKATFDIVNSVTVLQHIPEDLQREAMRHAAGALKKGGYLVLLENTADFGPAVVFPHRLNEWISMAEASGLELCRCWGSNYEVLFRAVAPYARRLLRGNKLRSGNFAEASASTQRQPAKRQLRSALRSLMAIGSFPLEWLVSRVPLFEPSHQVMIFRK